MKLLNRMFRERGILPSENIGGDAVTVSDSESVYVVGHKGLREFREDFIQVKMRGYLLEIHGINLKIIAICADEIFIKGKISGVARA